MSKLLTLSWSKSTLYICNPLNVKTAALILALHDTNLFYIPYIIYHITYQTKKKQ